MLDTSNFSLDGATKTYLAFSSDLEKADKGFRTSMKKKFSSGILIMLPNDKKCLFTLDSIDIENQEIISWDFVTDCKNMRNTKMRIYNS